MAPDAYLPVLVFAVIAVAFPILAYLVGDLFRPHRRADEDDETYEAGEVPIGSARIQFHFQYFTFAVLFLVFDVVVAIAFLFAWAYTQLSSWDERMFVLGVISLFALGSLPIVAYVLKREEDIWI